MRGSSSPRGYPLTHMLALEGETEKWGEGTKFSRALLQADSSPGLSPEDPVGWGKEPSLPHSQPAVPVTQGPSLSNWPKLVGMKPASVTPGKDRTDLLPLPAFLPLSCLGLGHSVGDSSRPPVVLTPSQL